MTRAAAGKSPSSILSMLHGRASLRPSDVAFTFTDYTLNPSGDAQSLTWSQLSRRTMTAAREFALHAEVGDRALIPDGKLYRDQMNRYRHEVARAGIGRLNARHGPVPAGPRFLFLHRRREKLPIRSRVVGWKPIARSSAGRPSESRW